MGSRQLVFWRLKKIKKLRGRSAHPRLTLQFLPFFYFTFSNVSVSSSGRFLVEANPFCMRVGRVLLVLVVFGCGCPLDAAAPFTDGADGGGVGAQTELLLPQPGVSHTLCSAGPVPVVEAQQKTVTTQRCSSSSL